MQSQKEYEIGRQKVPEALLRNIGNESACVEHLKVISHIAISFNPKNQSIQPDIKGCDEIKDSIVTKLQHHSKLVASLVTLADFLKVSINLHFYLHSQFVEIIFHSFFQLEHAAATGIAADGMTGMDAGKVAEMKLKLMRNGTMSMV